MWPKSEVLDLTGCGFDVGAVATDLLFAGISVRIDPSDAGNPHLLMRRVSPEAIRKAGYRVVCIREWIDWGAGERHAESMLIVDVTAICDREVLPCLIATSNSRIAMRRIGRGQGWCAPRCKKSTGGVVAVMEWGNRSFVEP
jgi:hypothetical protein